MAHSGENYGYVMLGIAVATLGAPAITNTVLGQGYDINVVFAIGAVCAAISFLFLLLLEREMKREKSEAVAVGTKALQIKKNKIKEKKHYGTGKNENIIGKCSKE